MKAQYDKSGDKLNLNAEEVAEWAEHDILIQGTMQKRQGNAEEISLTYKLVSWFNYINVERDVRERKIISLCLKCHERLGT